MNFTKEQIDYIKKAVDHVDFLTGGSRNSKTKQIIEELQQENARLKDKIEKSNSLIDTILTFHLFGDTCPLEFGFEKDSFQEKAQKSFYEDDGEYCENNCDECYKKCWLKFFERIDFLKVEEN